MGKTATTTVTLTTKNLNRTCMRKICEYLRPRNAVAVFVAVVVAVAVAVPVAVAVAISFCIS